jgi:hypothetical protein
LSVLVSFGCCIGKIILEYVFLPIILGRGVRVW